MPTPQIMALKQWFLKHKRDFPWRKSLDPYAIWVSEVMLQQTRASVVIPYFKKWMTQFPTPSSLAKASLEEVFKVWEGLGYYSRARNLREGAIQLCKGDGILPSSLENLLKIKGIGPYTAGAILSFAFHQKSAAVDGNVARVISRYKGIEGDLTSSKGKKKLQEETFFLLPDFEPWIVMEAFIELGATLCLPNPKCLECPLKENCFAYLEKKTDLIPFKKKRKEAVYLERQVAVILHEQDVLVSIKKEGEVLGGLVEFPSFPHDPYKDLEEEIKTALNLDVILREELPIENQSFTVYRLDLYPSVLETFEKKEVPGFFWCPLDRLESALTFSSGHKRILKKVLSKKGALFGKLLKQNN